MTLEFPLHPEDDLAAVQAIVVAVQRLQTRPGLSPQQAVAVGHLLHGLMGLPSVPRGISVSLTLTEVERDEDGNRRYSLTIALDEHSLILRRSGHEPGPRGGDTWGESVLEVFSDGTREPRTPDPAQNWAQEFEGMAYGDDVRVLVEADTTTLGFDELLSTVEWPWDSPPTWHEDYADE